MTQRSIVQGIINDAAVASGYWKSHSGNFGPAWNDKSTDGSRILKYTCGLWSDDLILKTKIKLLAVTGVKKVYLSPDESKLCVKFKEPEEGAAQVLAKLRAYVTEDDQEYSVLELARVILDRVQEDLESV